MLTPKALAIEFLMGDEDQIEFIKYGWNEAIAEGLKEGYDYGGKDLWDTMVKEYPDRFSGEFPSSENALAAVIENFPTKQELEETWAKKNALNLQTKLEMLVPNLFPTVLLRIISEYAVTWIAFHWSPPQKQSISPVNGEQIHEQLRLLMNERRYGEVIELGNTMQKNEFAKYLYPLMTDIEHCKYLNGYLGCRNMLPSFLVQGNMELVRRAILELRSVDSDYHIFHGHIGDAIFLSIKKEQHDHAINLLRVERERHAATDEQRRLAGEMPEFDMLLRDFSKKLVMEDDSAPLKRFITLRRKELSGEHPNIFEVMCQGMVSRLKFHTGNPNLKRLLIDFVGQSSLLTSAAFAHGFLWEDNGDYLPNFIKYGWREALEEGLKEKYPAGGRKLWAVMQHRLPNQFSGEYPSTNEARAAALENFKPTKQDREEAWATRNARAFLLKLVARLQEPDISILLPSALWRIVVEYAATGATWVDVEDTAPPSPVPDSIMHSEPNSDSDSDSD